jgi:branched-chain amino acid transport system permease protein
MSHAFLTGKRTLLPALILLLSGILITAFGENYQVRVAYIFYVNLVIVAGLQIFMGNSNLAHLGHISFVGIAAYVVALLHTPSTLKMVMIPAAPWLAEIELDFITASVIALAITVAVAWISGLALCRLSGVASTIGTLALLVIVHVVLVNWVDVTRGPRAFFGIPVALNIWWAIGVSAFALFIAKFFRDSRDGVQLRATGDNLLAARAMGLNVTRLRLKAWVLSAFVCGLGGILFTLFMGTIAPKSFYFHLTFLTIAMLILGGMRSVSGAFIGTIVVAIGFEAMRNLENGPEILGLQLPTMFGLTGFFLGAIIVFVLAFRPDGILGNDEFEDHWRAFRANRKGH